MSVSQTVSGAPTVSQTPAQVRRHLLIDRLYHWLMAAVVLVLMGTAFLPILGYKFEWLGLHWTTGVALTALVLFHIVRAVLWQDFWSMVPDATDARNAWRRFASAIRRKSQPPALAGKYDGLQKLYHAGIATLVLAIVGSGLLMLLKIDTPLWRRNPYWFADYEWGWIYAVHGLAAMALLSMVIIHLYFAARPDEWRLTRSMFRGWITRREYEEHHDPRRWAAEEP